jgi:hypothetical protein
MVLFMDRSQSSQSLDIVAVGDIAACPLEKWPPKPSPHTWLPRLAIPGKAESTTEMFRRQLSTRVGSLKTAPKREEWYCDRPDPSQALEHVRATRRAAGVRPQWYLQKAYLGQLKIRLPQSFNIIYNHLPQPAEIDYRYTLQRKVEIHKSQNSRN